MSDRLRSALSIVVPAADAALADFRRRYFPRAVATRIPAHVTVLFPFAARSELSEQLLEDVGAHFLAFSRFDAALTQLDSFPEHLWLSPEPRGLFAELLRGTAARFPAFPPYGGAVERPAAHLTIAEAGDGLTLADLRSAAEQEVRPLLPLAFPVAGVTLMVEEPDLTWTSGPVFPLAG